jgi:uncharacterized membrane protein
MVDEPESGARSRRLRTGRFEAFSDGVFAIAITLLVLDIAVPTGAADHLLSSVANQWPVYLAYFISFSTIGAIWLAHSAITDYLDHTNPLLSRLNLLLLLFVSFLPYPTRLLAEYTGEESGERVAVTLYGVNLLLAAVLVSVLWRYSVREGLVRPDAEDEEVQTLTSRLTPSLGGYVVLIALGLFFPIVAIVGYLVIAIYLILPFGLIRGRKTSMTGRNGS